MKIFLHYRWLFIKDDTFIGEWEIFGAEVFLCHSQFFIKGNFIIDGGECTNTLKAERLPQNNHSCKDLKMRFNQEQLQKISSHERLNASCFKAIDQIQKESSAIAQRQGHIFVEAKAQQYQETV